MSKEAPYGYDTNGAVHTAETARMQAESYGRMPTTVDAEIVDENSLTTVDGYHVVDGKGRTPVSVMTERDLLEEMVTSQRQLSDLVENFMGSMDKNPMMKMFAGRMGK